MSWTPYALPFVTPFQTAQERFSVRRGFLVRAQDSAGREGYGEAAPLLGFGMESLAETERILREWAPRLQGLALEPDPAQPCPEALSALDDLRQASAARHGLECALADLAAQAANRPLHVWLLQCLGIAPGAPFPESIPVNATLGALDPEGAGEQARALVLDEFTTLKVKVGVGGPEADSRRIRAVRKAAPNANLRVDANGAWDESTALDWLRAHVDLHLEYAEQPIARGDLQAQTRLVSASPIPIAADESVLSEADVAEVLAARAAHVLVLKPMALGGPVVALKAAQAAILAGVPVVLTTSLEGAYGRAAALHTAAAAQALTPIPLPAMGLATGALLREDLVATPARPVAGRLLVPRGSGVGLGTFRFT